MGRDENGENLAWSVNNGQIIWKIRKFVVNL
jgi:hypothetical protein